MHLDIYYHFRINIGKDFIHVESFDTTTLIQAISENHAHVIVRSC